MKNSLTPKVLLALIFSILSSLPSIAQNPDLTPNLADQSRILTPTKDELKMTEDAKAPGASAVYLNFEDIIDDLHQERTVHARIKVLTEAGVSLGAVALPGEYGLPSSILKFEARTIHPDGSIHKLNGDAKLLVTVQEGKVLGYERSRHLAFQMPEVTVGSILEYRIQFKRTQHLPPSWIIQNGYYIRKAYFMYKPVKGLQPLGPYMQHDRYVWIGNGVWMNVDSDAFRKAHGLFDRQILPQGAKVTVTMLGGYELFIYDVPPAPIEEHAPPRNSYIYRVDFFDRNGSAVKDYWRDLTKTFREKAEKAMTQGPKLRYEALSNVQPSDDDITKARKLYHLVQSYENTSYTADNTIPYNIHMMKTLDERCDAELVVSQKSGRSDCIALAYTAMLRIVGIQAKPLAITDRQWGRFDVAYLVQEQLNGIGVAAMLNGRERYLDPGVKYTSFGSMSWHHENVGGFEEGEKGLNFIHTPSLRVDENILARVADVMLSPDGSCIAKLKIAMVGQNAMMIRQSAHEMDQQTLINRLKLWLAPMLPVGISASIDKISGYEDSNANLIIYVTAQGKLGSSTDQGLDIPAHFFASKGREPFSKPGERYAPIDVNFTEQDRDDVIYHLPLLLKVAQLPEDSNANWEDKATFKSSVHQQENILTVKRELARSFTVLDKSKYADLREFYLKVSQFDKQAISLTKATAQ